MQTEIVTEIHNHAAEPRARDLLLNALTVSSGAVDAISFLALGKVFSAFMTGNIAFLGLRVAGAGGPGVVAILVSMQACSSLCSSERLPEACSWFTRTSMPPSYHS